MALFVTLLPLFQAFVSKDLKVWPSQVGALFPFFHVFLTMESSVTLKKKSRSAVRKDNLRRRIEEEGFVMTLPCTRCARLGKSCIKTEGSNRCSECVKATNCRCETSEASFSDAEWRRLVRAQQKLEDDEERANEEMAMILARLNRYKKQKKLLRRRAGDFISRDIEEIEELERLEENERRAREEQEEVQRQRDRLAAENHNISATWEDPSLTQMMASPSFWENLDFSAVGDIGSPSGHIRPNAQ